MKIKKFGVSIIALIMCLGMFSTVAFALADEIAESKPPKEVVERPVTDTLPEPMKPLTPDGNLTLVDDEGESRGDGKQFITVVTKTGNYFYIIIDRDDKGEQTVHFLNQVDEADLLKLMDEKEAEQFKPVKPEPEPKPEKEQESVPVTEPPSPVVKKSNMMPILLAIMVLAGCAGFFVFKKFKKKQQEKEKEKPDPDADYVDYDLDYEYEEAEDIEESEDMEGDDYIDEVDEDTEPV